MFLPQTIEGFTAPAKQFWLIMQFSLITNRLAGLQLTVLTNEWFPFMPAMQSNTKLKEQRVKYHLLKIKPQESELTYGA